MLFRSHPGQSREEAIAHLRRVKAEEAALNAETPETPNAAEAEPPEDTAESETTGEITGEMPMEDDTSEEIEDEAVSEVREELQAILDALSYEEGETDLPAIRASVENIKDSLAKINA